MGDLKDTSNLSLYRDVIDQMKKKGTRKLDEDKTKNTLKYRSMLKIMDSISAILGVAGISIEYYLTQILFYENPEYTITKTYNNLCYINIVLTIILSNHQTVFGIFCRYFIKDKLIRIKKSNLESEGFNSHLITGLIAEVLICSIISLPNVDVEYKGTMRGDNFTYHLTDIIMMISLLRSYLVIRLYEHYSKWTSFKSSVICKKYGTTADIFFAVKSDLKDRPFITIGIMMVLLVVLFGVATMQSEKSFDGKVSGMDQLTNNEWLIVITMTTVGYGDLFPTTHFGRFFCLLACISGMILVSAMVVAMNLASEFNKDQSIAYLAIKAKKREEDWLSSASNVLKAAFRSARCPTISPEKFKSTLVLKQVIFKFKRKTQLNSLMDITSAEMLYDLQHKLEEKLLATKSIIQEIPNLKERCERMKAKQVLLDEGIDRVMSQQKVISESLNLFQSSSTAQFEFK